MTGNKTGRLSIFHRMLITHLIVVIGISGALTTVFYVYIKDFLIRHAEEHIFREFEAIGRHFNHEFKDILERDLQILSANPIIGDFMMSSELEYEINARAMERLFLQSIQYTESYQGISFVDYSGKEKVRVGRAGRIRNYRDLSGSKLFTKIKAGFAGNINVEGPFLDKQGKALFSVGIYKTDEDIGEFGGAVIVESNLDEFFKDLDKIKIFGENPIWLLTPDGQVLRQPENRKAIFDPRPYISKGFHETPQVLMLNKGMLAYQDLSIVPGNNFLRMAISIPSSLLLEDINSALRFFFIVFLLSIVLLTMILYYLSRHLSLPIIKLARAADRLAKGDLSARVDVRTSGEVQTLVDSFNRMSKDLEKTTVSREKYQNQNKFLHNVIESISHPFYVVDVHDYSIKLANSAAGPAGEWRNATCHSLTHKNDKPCEDKDHGCPLKLVKKSKRPVVLEHLHYDKDGKLKHYEVHGHPVFNDNGDVVQMIEYSIDITERKKAQEALQVYALKLEQSNRELEQFAYIASHDLQEPLRKVTAFGDRLKAKYAESLGDQGKDYLERMQNATRRMQTLINDLLMYSRVTTKAQPFVPVDLNRVAQEVITDMEIRIEQTGGRVEVDNLPKIDADPLQMRQLFQNLIGNALKFHKKDEPPAVMVFMNGNNPDNDVSHNNSIQISIKDNGIGFDEKHEDRIFGVFQRLHGRNEYEGTGIGLSVCKKIVERHGGSIKAKSILREGTTFIVTLPVKHAKQFTGGKAYG